MAMMKSASAVSAETSSKLHCNSLHGLQSVTSSTAAAAMWSSTAGPCSDETAIVPLLSGISLGLSDVGSSMERQCALSSRLSNGYCTVPQADNTAQGSFGTPYSRHGFGSSAADFYCANGNAYSGSDCGVLPYLSIASDGTPLLPHPVGTSTDQYLLNHGGLAGLPCRLSADSKTSSASSSSCGKDPGRNGGDPKESRVCGVCGDKALGYNFDAISCESCKAFFRRNAPKGLDHFKCAYDYMCKMDLSNRRFCKRCRLGKCFQIGMRREYILTDDERAMKRQKIIENRLKRGSSTQSASSTTSGNSETATVASSPATTPTTAAEPITAASISSSSSTNSASSSTTPVTSPATTNGVAAQVSSQTVALCPDDATAIEELVTAYGESLKVQTDSSVDPTDCSSSQFMLQQHFPHNAASSFSDLVNIAELSVRRVIAMAKQMRAFRAISHDDQIQLLKGGSIELLILRSVITFDKDKQQFLDPLDQEETKAMKVEQLRHAEQGTGLFDDHMAFVRSLAFDLNVDETSLILLLVIALFSPDRDRLTDRELVAAEQERYTVLLKRYLESILPKSSARSVFPKLLHKLADVRDLNEKHSLVLLKVNPVGIQPLMKEVLDIDH